MADSVYPNELDDDVVLPRIDDNLTEIGAEAINGLRSAVFNIEEAIGLNPQGTAEDLTTRISVSLNPDGTLKASALTAAGLISLPITNSQVASNAGIEESKLDLDFSTTNLRTLIANLEVFTNAINTNLLQDIGNLNQHIAHPATYGRHRTSDIDGYAAPFAGLNLQGIITYLNDVLSDHIGSIKVGAHQGQNISIDDTFLNISASDVQTAIEQLDELQDTLLISHRDNFHSNGILRAQNVYLDGYNHAGLKVASGSLISVSAGISFVQYSSPPLELATVVRGDILKVSSGSQVFSFSIDRVNATTGEVHFFGKLPVSISTPVGAVYAKTDETNAAANLILARRQTNVIQMVHPGAAFVLSNRADARKITSAVKNIKIRWQDGDTGDLDVKLALETYISNKPSAWTVENLAYALNQVFRSSSPYPPKRPYPIVAFSYNGEFGIAYDEAVDDAYVEIVAPSANSASTALGLVEGTVNFGLGPRRVSIDGYQLSYVQEKLQSTGQATGNSIDTFPPGVSVLGSGVDTGDLVRVFGGTNAANKGSFVTSAVSAAAITFSPSPGFITENVGFRVWADTFSQVVSPTYPTLYELFADEYNGEEIRLFGAPRVEYKQAVSSTENLQQVFDITDVSRGFVAGSRRIYFDLAANTATLGQVGSGDTLAPYTSGTPVTLPNSVNAAGFKFKLYDNNNSDYVEIHLANTTYLSFLSSCALDVTIYDRIGEDKFLQLGVVLHNTSEFRHLSDRRMFGNVGRADIRDDFSRDYISYPASKLRSNGVIQGMQVFERNDGNIDAYGGEVFVNGSISVISTRDIGIPQDGDATTYNVFVQGGRVQLLRNDQTIGTNGAVIATPSISEILASDDKLLLAQVDVNASNVITAIRDYRRFVNKIDDKLELSIEENDITNGGFASFSALSNWLTAVDNLGLPSSRVVKIRGVVELDLNLGAVSIPSGVSVVGDTVGNNSSTIRPTIKLTGAGASAFSVGNGVSFENILFKQDVSADLTDSVFTGTNIQDFNLRHCHFEDISGTGGSLDVIKGTSVSNCYVTGCLFDFGAANQNTISVIAGSSANNVRVENSKISVSGADYAPTIIGASTTGTDIYLTNVETDYDTSNYLNSVIYAPTLLNVFVNNCNFNLGVGTLAESSIISCNNITNAFVDDNIISYASSHAENQVIFASSSITNVNFTGNHLNKVSLVISSLTGSGLKIVNNSGSDLVLELLLCPTLSDSDISSNIMVKSTAGAPFISVVTLGSKINISKNTFYSSDAITVPTNRKMISLANVTDVMVNENILQNYGASGFSIGIYIDNATNLHCSKNIVKNLTFNSTCYGLYLLNSSISTIEGNEFKNVYTSFISTSNDDLIFHSNYCESTSGIILSILGTCENNTFSNNIFKSLATTNIGTLFYNISTMTKLLVCGNLFVHSHTSITVQKLLHMENLNTCSVNNNMFYSGGGGGQYSVAPVYLDGTNVVCKNNNLRNLVGLRSGSNQLVSVAGTGSVDAENFGQEYTSAVAISGGIMGAQWTNNSIAAKKGRWSATTLGVGDANYAIVDWDSTVIPIQSTLTKVSFYFSQGLTASLRFAIRRASPSQATGFEIATVDASAVGFGSVDLDLSGAGSEAILTSDKMFAFTSQILGSTALEVTGIMVYYIL